MTSGMQVFEIGPTPTEYKHACTYIKNDPFKNKNLVHKKINKTGRFVTKINKY